MKSSLQTYPLPWARILARGIDTLIYSGFIYIFFPLLGCLLDDLIFRKYGPSGEEGYWFFWSCWIVSRTCFFLIYEIFFLSLLSSTPGKALLGLSVVELDGSRLLFSSAVSRTIRLCGCLFLFFIPYISLLIPISCLANLYDYKTRSGTFIWDRNNRWIVTNEEKVPIIFKLIGALFLALFLLLVVSIISSAPNTQAILRNFSMIYKIYVF